jgi:hypothetical protein
MLDEVAFHVDRSPRLGRETFGEQKGETYGEQKGETFGEQKGETFGGQKGETFGEQGRRPSANRNGCWVRCFSLCF